MSSFGAAQDFEGFDDGAPVSVEVDYLDVDDASPPISSEEGDEYAFPPNLSPESNEKLDECATKIREHNAEEILAGILQKEQNGKISSDVHLNIIVFNPSYMERFVMAGVFASVALLMSSAAAQVPDYDYRYLPDESISPANSEDDEAYAPVMIEYGFPLENLERNVE
ncbi:hypothetical protein ACLB2K_021542 [Fragaria x ananassa]